MIDGHLHLMEYMVPFNCNGWGRPVGDGCILYDTGETVRILPKGLGEYGFSCEAALELMDKNEIEMAVLMQSGGYGLQNAYAMEAAERFPNRFFPVASLDPYCLKRNEILENLTSKMGFGALKFEMSEVGGFHGYHAHFEIAGPEFEDVFRLAQERDMSIAFDLGGTDQASYQLHALKEAVMRYDRVHFVFCHILCPNGRDIQEWERDVRILAGENVWFDFSSLPHFLGESPPFEKSLEYLERAAEIVGADRLIWGSDAPSSLVGRDYSEYRNYFMNTGAFSAAELKQMTADNAVKAYSIKNKL